MDSALLLEENAAALAIELDKKELQGRKMEVKLSIPEQERKGEAKGKQSKEKPANLSSTIYVTGLPNGVSEYEFSVFFSKVCVLSYFIIFYLFRQENIRIIFSTFL